MATLSGIALLGSAAILFIPLLLVSLEASAQAGDATNKVQRYNSATLCVELGRVLRKPDTTARGEAYEMALLTRAKRDFGVQDSDRGYIRERRPRIGMGVCSLLAAMGSANHSNVTVTADGRREQLVYTARRMYVYLENSLVVGWQE
jgi:hypothetical protein